MTFNDSQEIEQEQPGAADGADVAEATSEGEGEFVVGEQKPAGRTGLILGGLVLLAVAVVYVMYSRGGPQQAGAAPAAEAANASASISKFLQAGDENIRLMQKMLHSTEKVVQQFLSYPSMKQVPLADLHTNPFRAYAEKAAPKVDEEAQRQKQLAAEKAAAIEALEKLNLQSIFHGSKPACMVNNTMYREGQVVDGFTIERINPSSIIVKRGQFRFERRMQK